MNQFVAFLLAALALAQQLHADNCTVSTSCSNCLAVSSCGWCSSSMSCVTGDARGSSFCAYTSFSYGTCSVSVVSVYAAVAIALLVTLVAIGCGIYCWRRRAKMAVLLQKTAYDRGMSQMVQRFKTKYETGNSRSWFKI